MVGDSAEGVWVARAAGSGTENGGAEVAAFAAAPSAEAELGGGSEVAAGPEGGTTGATGAASTAVVVAAEAP